MCYCIVKQLFIDEYNYTDFLFMYWEMQLSSGIFLQHMFDFILII